MLTDCLQEQIRPQEHAEQHDQHVQNGSNGNESQLTERELPEGWCKQFVYQILSVLLTDSTGNMLKYSSLPTDSVLAKVKGSQFHHLLALGVENSEILRGDKAANVPTTATIIMYQRKGPSGGSFLIDLGPCEFTLLRKYLGMAPGELYKGEAEVK